MRKRVLLGMSGGVDSSVVAMMLQNDGYEVIGVTFVFSDLTERNKIIVSEAGELAEKLKIEHIVVDLREEFNKHIIHYFTNEYKKGNTPFPCAKCNPEVKFMNLLKYANKLDCNFIATGHYARILLHNGKKFILKGVDSEKDQSFFLWGLNKEILDRLILPLGSVHKKDTRNYANNLGFSKLSNKKDSLGVCFIEGNNYRNFLELKGVKLKPGNFINKDGDTLGQHTGIFNYTIGQRRGLGINLNKPMFVYEMNAERNEIVLSEYNDLYKNLITINNVHIVDKEDVINKKIFTLKIRYRLQNTPCKLELLNENRALIHLLEPLAMVAKGQAAVLYDGDRVIGGGFIESCE